MVPELLRATRAFSAFSAAWFALSGCGGHLQTDTDPKLTGKDTKVDGVITYPQINVIELYRTTLHVDPKSGNIVASLAAKNCQATLVTRYAVRTDFSRPQVISYSPGFLDKNKFSVTLKDGVLASVNTESDPVSGLKDVAAVLPFVRAPYAERSVSIAGADLGAAPSPVLACNAGEKLLGVFATPEIQPYADLKKLLE